MAAANDDVICETQTPGGAGAMTLVTAAGITLDVPRHVIVTSAADETTKTFTITGTDRYGASMSEVITGANTGISEGAYNFKTVTSVVASAATTGAMIVGTNATLESQWIPLHRKGKRYAYSVDLTAAASLAYQVQKTLDNVLAVGFREYSAHVISHLDIETEDMYEEGYVVPAAFRVKLVEWVSGSLDFTIQVDH